MSCNICTLYINLNDRICAPCFHIFCGQCIDTWMKKKRECPVCRIDITSLAYNRNVSLDGVVEEEPYIPPEDDIQHNEEPDDANNENHDNDNANSEDEMDDLDRLDTLIAILEITESKINVPLVAQPPIVQQQEQHQQKQEQKQEQEQQQKQNDSDDSDGELSTKKKKKKKSIKKKVRKNKKAQNEQLEFIV